MMKNLIIFVVVAIAAAVANAAITTDFVKVNELNIEGTDYKVWDMMVTTHSNWTNSVMDLTLTVGELYQDPMGGIIETCWFPLPPPGTVEWDTYVTRPDVCVDHPGLPGVPMESGTDLDVSWHNLPNDGPGTWKIARVTLSTNAGGTIQSRSYDVSSQGRGAEYSFTIDGGEILPEPAEIMGDADHSGYVDDDDLSLLLANWNQETDWMHGEFNGTTPVDDDDLNLILANWHEGAPQPSFPPPDFSGDWWVDDDDLSLVYANWHMMMCTWDDGDATLNGYIDDDDLSVVLSQWGPVGMCGSAAAPVPEPAVLSLLALGALGLIWRKRRA